MPFDLQPKTGELTQARDEVYHVHPGHPAYEYLWHACLSFEVMAIAASVRKDLDTPDDGHLSLPCKAFGCTVILPAHSLINAVLAQRHDEHPFIEITFEWSSNWQRIEWAIGIRKWMERTLASGFVELYEENRKRIHQGSKKIANAARVVRDAFSHNFKIKNDKGYKVDLDQLKISKANNREPLWNFIDLGDIFVLTMRMFSEPESGMDKS